MHFDNKREELGIEEIAPSVTLHKSLETILFSSFYFLFPLFPSVQQENGEANDMESRE